MDSDAGGYRAGAKRVLNKNAKWVKMILLKDKGKGAVVYRKPQKEEPKPAPVVVKKVVVPPKVEVPKVVVDEIDGKLYKDGEFGIKKEWDFEDL